MEKTYEVVIYGRPNCPFCVRAKQFAEGVSNSNTKFTYSYVDIWDENITMDNISEAAGKTVTTVPQIFNVGEHIGGYREFEKFIIDNDLF